ncbi:MAG: YggT family protein [Betaproteobacteria bacterium]|nr:YggT family protein [Betaproteobacteria bacterium]
MVADALVFLIHAIFGFFASLLLLRFWMQWCRAATRNPLSMFVQSMTNFAVLPARRFIPGLWGHDLATLVLAWLTLVIELVLLVTIKGAPPGSGGAFGVILLGGLVMLVRYAIYLAIVVVILQAVLSWVNAASPIAPVVNALSGPLLKPIQRVVPLIGGIDISPLIALLALQVVLIPLSYMARALGIAF